MKKKLIIGSALALTLSLGAPALAAPTTLTDVPKNHWSYDAVTYLVQAGVIEGYGDKTFRGDKTMTRNEMAEVVYKAMLSQGKANIAQKALIDKLASEYALEMNKINTMDTRLSAVEQNQSNIKFTGSLLMQQKIKSMTNDPSQVGWSSAQFQFRLNGTAKVDDKTTLGVRLVNVAPTKDSFKDSTANYAGLSGGSGGSTTTNTTVFDRFFATTKLGIVKATLGRQAMEIDSEDVIVDSAFFSYDGAKIAWTSNNVNFDIKHGRLARDVRGYAFDGRAGDVAEDIAAGKKATYASAFSNVDVESINVSSKNGKLKWNVGAAEFRNWKIGSNLLKYYYGYTGWQFDRKFSVGAEYGKNQIASEGGRFWTAKAVYGSQALKKKNDQNITFQYWDLQKNALYTAYTSIDTVDEGNSHAAKTVDMSYRYAFSNNMTGKIQYAKVTDKDVDTNSYSFWKAQFIYKF